MDTIEARAVFDKMIEETTDPDVRATRELLREFFTNEEFRAKFATFSYEHTRPKARRK